MRMQVSANAACLSHPRLEHIITLAVASRLCQNPTKQRLLALHRQIYTSTQRDAAQEALLEKLQALYWNVALGAHLSTFQSRSEVGWEVQESCVYE
tara:strand:- start:2451 stop:2738 length:288 start_codon:yes stop_codon:yes gene_type:complete